MKTKGQKCLTRNFFVILTAKCVRACVRARAPMRMRVRACVRARAWVGVGGGGVCICARGCFCVHLWVECAWNIDFEVAVIPRWGGGRSFDRILYDLFQSVAYSINLNLIMWKVLNKKRVEFIEFKICHLSYVCNPSNMMSNLSFILCM